MHPNTLIKHLSVSASCPPVGILWTMYEILWGEQLLADPLSHPKNPESSNSSESTCMADGRAKSQVFIGPGTKIK